MKLPHFDKAVIDIRKLTDYVLDPESPRGRHKARVFQAALGVSTDDAEWLKSAILDAIGTADADIGEKDFYGQRYSVDCRIKNDVGEAIVRTAWIILVKESLPRLTSCYVLKGK